MRVSFPKCYCINNIVKYKIATIRLIKFWRNFLLSKSFSLKTTVCEFLVHLL